MSDKEVSKNTAQGNNNTKKQETANVSASRTSPENTHISYSSSTSSSASNKPSSTATADKAETNKAKTKPATTKVTAYNKSETSSLGNKSVNEKAKTDRKTSNNQQLGKGAKITAAIALIIALLSVAASVGHYFWQQQQTNAKLLTLSQENQQAMQHSQAQLKRSLTAEFNQQLEQQYQVNNQSQQSAQKAYRNTDEKLQLLAAQVKQLEGQVSQRDPSDWLVHEAEYLVRIAARTMWLERDTTAAISLLRDADSRLKELNQPKFLPVRALINEDIENLALMPALTNEEAILTLMALNKQIANLTLAGVNLAEALDEVEEDFALSDDLGDWQENLARTWQKFIKDFITVRRRAGMVEPLMSPDQQQHLRQNLSLKIQLVQWAASEQKEAIYQQTLLDIQQWLNQFFDMNSAENKSFYSSIEKLKEQTIYYDYPSDLRSLTLIKRLLTETKQGKQVSSTGSKAKKNKAPENNTTEEAVIETNSSANSNADSPKTESDNANGDKL